MATAKTNVENAILYINSYIFTAEWLPHEVCVHILYQQAKIGDIINYYIALTNI